MNIANICFCIFFMFIHAGVFSCSGADDLPIWGELPWGYNYLRVQTLADFAVINLHVAGTNFSRFVVSTSDTYQVC
jgi:hypothetical protein